MRVDINQVSSSQIELEKSSSGKASQQPTSASTNIEDRASLTTDSTTVAALQQKALHLPEVRQGKVDALKQQIQSGQYKADPDETAKAMREDGF